MDRASQQELLITTMADFLVESSLSIPMTVGIYSHWGNGKSTHTQRLMGKEIYILYKFFVMPTWSFSMYSLLSNLISILNIRSSPTSLFMVSSFSLFNDAEQLYADSNVCLTLTLFTEYIYRIQYTFVILGKIVWKITTGDKGFLNGLYFF